MDYLTQKFQKLVSKRGGSIKEEAHDSATSSSGMCYNRDQPGHTMRDCLVLEVDHKEVKDQEGDQTVKREITAWEDSSSVSVDFEHSDEAFMEKFDDEEYEEEKLRSLAVVLIDSFIELTTENDLMNNSLDILREEKVALVDQMSIVEEQLMVLEAENLEQKLKMLSKKCGSGKGEANNLQIELETSLNTAETKLAMALERNNQLERDLVRVKEELNKSLKWTNSSKFLAKITSQGQNDSKGLGNSSKSPSYNLHGKDVSMSDSLSCLHYGRDGHLKKDCPAWTRTQDKLSKYSKQRNKKKKGPGQQSNKQKKRPGQQKNWQKKGPGRAPIPTFKKINLPHWTKNSLITSLSAYWEL
ncbi:hypothetical protein KY285_033519 [Solanum tuberosum]|nr:hypothetical protein KY285_033519 [Solanum tuberosum]